MLVFCVAAAALASAPAVADVLIACSPGQYPAWAQDVADKIAGTGKVQGDIDLFNIRTGTPTLPQLQEYEAVMVFTDGGAQNTNLLGDNLADYCDGGGGVVQCTFSWNEVIPISGRWRSGGYSPLTYAGQNQMTRLTIGTRHLPNHPALADVVTFDGGSASFHNTGTYAPNAIKIADWSNGMPLVAEMPGKNGGIIGLNFYPPSSDARTDFWEVSTDGDHLLANAVVYVSGGGVDCDLIKKFKVKCRNNKLKAIVKSNLPEGTQLTIVDNVQKTVVTTNAKGKAKLKKKGQTGMHLVSIKECPEFEQEVDCG